MFLRSLRLSSKNWLTAFLAIQLLLAGPYAAAVKASGAPCEHTLAADVNQSVLSRLAVLAQSQIPETRRIAHLVTQHFAQSLISSSDGHKPYIAYIGAIGAAQFYLSALAPAGTLNIDSREGHLLILELDEAGFQKIRNIKSNSEEVTRLVLGHHLASLARLTKADLELYLRSRGLMRVNDFDLRSFTSFKTQFEDLDTRFIHRLREGFKFKLSSQLETIENLVQMILDNEWPLIIAHGRLDIDGAANLSPFSSFVHDLVDHFLTYSLQPIRPEERVSAQASLLRITDPTDLKVANLIYYAVLHERIIGVPDLMSLVMKGTPLGPDSLGHLRRWIELELAKPRSLKNYLEIQQFRIRFAPVLELLKPQK